MCRRLTDLSQLSWWNRESDGFWGDPERFHTLTAYEKSAHQRGLQRERDKSFRLEKGKLLPCRKSTATRLRLGFFPKNRRCSSIGAHYCTLCKLWAGVGLSHQSMPGRRSSQLKTTHVLQQTPEELCGGEDAAAGSPSELAMLTAAPLL